MTYPSLPVDNHLYYITATICGWKPIFEEQIYTQIILDSFTWLSESKACRLFAFVVMPTHTHFLIFPEAKSISSITHSFGSFTAHQILKQLETDERHDLLEFFKCQVVNPTHRHRIWQDIQAENIFTVEFAQQKMEYIHQNPARGENPLVTCRSDYLYSSACYYDYGKEPIIPVDDIREFLST